MCENETNETQDKGRQGFVEGVGWGLWWGLLAGVLLFGIAYTVIDAHQAIDRNSATIYRLEKQVDSLK